MRGRLGAPALWPVVRAVHGGEGGLLCHRLLPLRLLPLMPLRLPLRLRLGQHRGEAHVRGDEVAEAYAQAKGSV